MGTHTYGVCKFDIGCLGSSTAGSLKFPKDESEANEQFLQRIVQYTEEEAQRRFLQKIAQIAAWFPTFCLFASLFHTMVVVHFKSVFFGMLWLLFSLLLLLLLWMIASEVDHIHTVWTLSLFMMLS